MVVACGLGLVWLTLVLILLGLIGIYTVTAMYVVWALWLLFAVIRSVFILNEWFSLKSPEEKETEWLPLILRVSIIVTLIVYFATVLTPETRHDPYDYHLTIPTLYLAKGMIHEIPWHVFTYMPKNGEILYGLALGVGNDSLAKMIHYLFGCMCVLAIASFLYHRQGKEAGMLAVVLVTTLPLFGFLATSSYVDLIRSFWELMALYCLTYCWDKKESEGKPEYWLIFSTLFAGMALGSKYVAWLVFFPPYLVCFALTLWHLRSQLSVRHVLIMFPCIVVPVLPWLTLNAFWTGNPIYPLFPSCFGMHISPAPEAYEFFRNHAPKAEVYAFPQLFSFLGMRFNRLLMGGNALFPVGVAALLIVPWWHRSGDERVIAGVFYKGLLIFIIFSGLLFFLGTDNHDGRFCFTTLALLSIPAVLFLYSLGERVNADSGRGQLILSIVVLAFFINGLSYRFTQLKDLRESLVPIVTQGQRQDWLLTRFPNYPVIAWANENLPRDATVLGMGYPLSRNHISGIKYGYIPFLHSIESNISEEKLAKRLQENGITHVVKPYLSLPGTIDLTRLEKDYLVSVFLYRGTRIFELRIPQSQDG